MTKKIVFVNQYNTQIFQDLIRTFTEHGWETHLVTGKNSATEQLLPHTRYTRLISYNRKNFITRFISWIAFTLQCIPFLLTRPRHTVLFLVTNPPIMPWIGALLNRTRKLKYFLLIYDVYPEALQHAGLVGKGSFIYRVWTSLNKIAFKHCSGAITLSREMKEQLPKLAEGVAVIPNWADTNTIRPMDKTNNPFIKQHGLENKLVVLYSGNFGLTHDFEGILRAAEILSKRYDIHFVFIGDGAKVKLIRDYAFKYENITHLPFQPEDQIPYSFAAGDIGLVTLDQSMEQVSVPSKTFYYIAAGCVLLAVASEKSVLSEIVKQHQNGVCIIPGSPGKIAEFIQELADKPKLKSQYQENSLKAAKCYSPANAKKYVEFVERRLNDVR